MFGGEKKPSMSVLNELMERLVPKNDASAQLKTAWKMWYSNLDWYEKSVGSKVTHRDAKSRLTAFYSMNGELMNPSESVFGADVSEALGTIRLGDTGSTVAAWQKALKIAATGVFDNATLETTKNHQRSLGLEIDGVVGPASWRSIKNKPTLLSNVIKSSKMRPYVGVGFAALAGGLLAIGVIPSRKSK